MNHRAPSAASSDIGRWASRIIHASAGTGKTYHLSNRYLQLLLAGQSADRILATTFTRKAAGEILQRVVYRLAVAAAGEAACATLAEQLAWPALRPAECEEALRRLTRQLHRVRVATLDSFFLQIARTLSLELGLPPNWQIVDEHEERRIRTEAVAALLRQEDSQTVVQLMHWLTQGEAGRRVHDLLDETVGAAYELFLEAPPAAWECLQRQPERNSVELAEILAQLREQELPADKRIRAAFDKDLERAELGKWAALLDSGIGKKIAAGESQYYRVDLPENLIRAYEPLMEHARACLINGLVTQNEATYQLLKRFHEQHAALQHERRALRFSDLARSLVQLESSNHLRLLPFRLDAAVESLLLDEFQDTALLQWIVIRPFARYAAAATSRRSFLCVGDVKQAIYGWRGGDADLLQAVGQELPHAQPEELDVSYRSAPEIITAVNAIHQGLARHPNLGEATSAIRRWSAGFPAHSTTRNDLCGWTTLETAAAADEEESQAEATMRAAAHRVRQLVHQSPTASVAVLVRTNESVGRMINLLRSCQVAASEEGGNPLIDSAAVGLVLSLLRLADHPGDTSARYHLARSPWGRRLGMDDFRDAEAAARLSNQVRQRLADGGYGTTLGQAADALRPHCDAREWRRLNQLVQLGVLHQARLDTPRHIGFQRQLRLSPRTKAFVEWVEQQRVSDPSVDRVRVMTVHQSKGLQFDHVVLPDLDRRVPARLPHSVLHRPGATQPIDAVCRYAKEDLRALLPHRLQQVFADHTAAQIREELCVLYVSLTRAIRTLHLVIAPSRPSERKLPRTMAGWIRGAVTDQQPLEPEAVCWECGQPSLPEPEPLGAAQPVDQVESIMTRVEVPSARVGERGTVDRPEPTAEATPRGLEVTAPSDREGGGRVRLGDCLRRSVGRAMAHGVLVHAFFELVEWLDEEPPDDQRLQRVARRLDSNPRHIAQAIQDFHAAIARPQVRRQLSRRHYDPWIGAAQTVAVGELSLEVRREQTLAVRVDGTILSGAIDRLVLLRENGRPRFAEIIDFKTDRVRTAAQRKEREAYYEPQLRAYRIGLSRMLQLDPQQITAQLLFLDDTSDES